MVKLYVLVIVYQYYEETEVTDVQLCVSKQEAIDRILPPIKEAQNKYIDNKIEEEKQELIQQRLDRIKAKLSNPESTIPTITNPLEPVMSKAYEKAQRKKLEDKLQLPTIKDFKKSFGGMYRLNLHIQSIIFDDKYSYPDLACYCYFIYEREVDFNVI